ncbi:MAG: C2H2-type zinc finger protein [Candidatus Bathyarchaeota archaeon]|nr:C2H2-type zinc finger protein [Candidatus Bathyarchaeota archaeon]
MKSKWNDKATFMSDEFECPLCKEVFADPAELRRHRQQAHRNIMNEIKYRT